MFVLLTLSLCLASITQGKVLSNPSKTVVVDDSVFEGITTESWSEDHTATVQWDENSFTTIQPHKRPRPVKVDKNSTATRLLGAQTATLSDHPYVVYVLAKDNDDPAGTQRECTGVLISESYVLTSAYCCVDAYSLEVYAGNIAPGDGTLSLGECIVFPWFSRNPREHDIALIELHMPYTFSDDIDQVTLPPYFRYNKYWSLAERTVRVIGFGPGFESDSTTDMNFVDMEIPNYKDCYFRTKQLRYRLGPFTACLDTDSSTKGVCYGDRGAPVILTNDDVLIGIVSEYFRCADTPVFTLIGPYLPWIRLYVPYEANSG